MLSYFTVHFYLYHSVFVTEGTVILQEKSMIHNFPNYIKLEGEQTFNVLEEPKELKFINKKNILIQCSSIFTSSTLYFLTNIPIINERNYISILDPTGGGGGGGGGGAGVGWVGFSKM